MVVVYRGAIGWDLGVERRKVRGDKFSCGCAMADVRARASRGQYIQQFGCVARKNEIPLDSVGLGLGSLLRVFMFAFWSLTRLCIYLCK